MSPYVLYLYSDPVTACDKQRVRCYYMLLESSLFTTSLHTFTNMYGSHRCQSHVPVFQFQLLYAIRILTGTTLLDTFTNMYGSNKCQSHVPVLQYSYCMPFESSLALYQCTLLPICTVATVVNSNFLITLIVFNVSISMSLPSQTPSVPFPCHSLHKLLALPTRQ
jgi:hypothetical protein